MKAELCPLVYSPNSSTAGTGLGREQVGAGTQEQRPGRTPSPASSSAGSEVKQQRLEPALIWDASVASGSLTCCTTLVLWFFFNTDGISFSSSEIQMRKKKGPILQPKCLLLSFEISLPSEQSSEATHPSNSPCSGKITSGNRGAGLPARLTTALSQAGQEGGFLLVMSKPFLVGSGQTGTWHGPFPTASVRAEN